MTYTEWFETHARKHREIVSRLIKNALSPEEIVAYFDYETMAKKEQNFCLLYPSETKCHTIPRLNCYWCACPYFRFNDNPDPDASGVKIYSFCVIDAPKGTAFRHGNALHHDCSECTVAHDAQIILKNFSADWTETMSECPLKS